jgi:hypothetical protein
VMAAVMVAAASLLSVALTTSQSSVVQGAWLVVVAQLL